ncbi:MAG: D-arabinose 5-phosphate isomerase [Bacteroidetes bacterium GWE2_29_8]|nr:MAG: D-arabinose 5-phosphate isomerase [Bacteroidetes bacterium GWE2_29_8]OFY23980.1 MAG: D-arabinose 5-phosphate isomerase [Bacteroidetes bacterium GWF2_29_10]
MKKNNEILNIAKNTIEQEAHSVRNLINFIDDNFIECVNIIFNCKGRIIITGIGKSAIISQKIVATLNSTGTPSIFMHAADAVHGDLGIIQKDDMVICISKSGDTPEIKILAPVIKSMGNKLIAIVGNINSFLAKNADYIINTTVEKEACINNLAPTSSTTAQLVMGDALAVCLIYCRGFKQNDFAKYHPGGVLGKQLYLKVADLYINNEKPQVNINDDLKKVIFEISSKRLGAAVVTDDNCKIKGIITDGDLRRMLQTNSYSNENITAKDIMSLNPKKLVEETLAVDALLLMKKYSITQIIIVDKEEKYKGIVHLHDILKEGII